MSRQLVMPLKTVQYYDWLVHGQRVKEFLQFLAAKAELNSIDDIKSCFLIAENLKEAYLFIAFCFGELQTVDFLPNDKVSEDVKAKLRTNLSKFDWDKKLPVLTMFQRNAEKFGNLYPYIRKQVISKLTEKESLIIFNHVKQSHLLNGVKIRKWQFGSYNQIRRNQEKAQLNRIDFTNYLFIAETQAKTYNVGVLYQEFQQDSRASISWPPEEQRQKIIQEAKRLQDQRKSFVKQPQAEKRQPEKRQEFYQPIPNLPKPQAEKRQPEKRHEFYQPNQMPPRNPQLVRPSEPNIKTQKIGQNTFQIKDKLQTPSSNNKFQRQGQTDTLPVIHFGYPTNNGKNQNQSNANMNTQVINSGPLIGIPSNQPKSKQSSSTTAPTNLNSGQVNFSYQRNLQSQPTHPIPKTYATYNKPISYPQHYPQPSIKQQTNIKGNRSFSIQKQNEVHLLQTQQKDVSCWQRCQLI